MWARERQGSGLTRLCGRGSVARGGRLAGLKLGEEKVEGGGVALDAPVVVVVVMACNVWRGEGLCVCSAYVMNSLKSREPNEDVSRSASAMMTVALVTLENKELQIKNSTV